MIDISFWIHPVKSSKIVYSPICRSVVTQLMSSHKNILFVVIRGCSS